MLGDARTRDDERGALQVCGLMAAGQHLDPHGAQFAPVRDLLEPGVTR